MGEINTNDVSFPPFINSPNQALLMFSISLSFTLIEPILQLKAHDVKN